MPRHVHLTPIGIDELPEAGHPLTTSLWASIKHMNGWSAHPFSIPSSGKHLLVLSKKILFFRIAYVPYADLGEVSEELMLQITDEVMRLSRLPFIFIRYEFAYGIRITGSWSSRRVRRCPFAIQPASSVLIHLDAEYETVRSRYTKRAKRALRKSRQAASDTILSDKQDSHIDRWLSLYQETAARDGFSARSREYIEGVLRHRGCVSFLLSMMETSWEASSRLKVTLIYSTCSAPLPETSRFRQDISSRMLSSAMPVIATLQYMTCTESGPRVTI